MDSSFKELAAQSLNTCELKGAQYSDIRIVNTDKEYYSAANGRMGAKYTQTALGCGVRVLIDGAWGFAACNGLGKAEVAAACKKAVELGRFNAEASRRKTSIGEPVISHGVYHTPVEIDPFALNSNDKVSLLVEAVDAMKRVNGIVNASGSMEFIRREKYFASSEGSQVHQVILESGAGLSAVASGQGDVQIRTFPTNLLRQQGTGGYELILDLNLVENAHKIAEEAVQLLSARECPTDEFDIICDPTLLAHILHEIAGHNTELDRILGDEMGYNGMSFVPRDLSQRFQYASPLVNIYLDFDLPPGFGDFRLR